jgi:selenocysteine lyase/cysteine desulfurase
MSTEPRKSSSCFAIGGIGCLVILLVIGVGAGVLWWKFGPQAIEFVKEAQKDPERAQATMMLKVHPDIELIEINDQNRTATFKIKSTGETITATFKALTTARIVTINGKTEVHGLDQSTENSPPATAPPVQ